MLTQKKAWWESDSVVTLETIWGTQVSLSTLKTWTVLARQLEIFHDGVLTRNSVLPIRLQYRPIKLQNSSHVSKRIYDSSPPVQTSIIARIVTTPECTEENVFMESKRCIHPQDLFAMQSLGWKLFDSAEHCLLWIFRHVPYSSKN